MNRDRVRGARIQTCIFAATNSPEPSVLLVRSVYGEWSVPQEGVMIGETVPDAAWRGLDEEVGIRVDDPGGERQLATQRDLRFLGRLRLPKERHGERPIADNVGDSPLGLVKMKSKAYWGVFLIFRSQLDVVAAPNEREVDAVEWCSFEKAAERIRGTARPAKAQLILDGLATLQSHLPTRKLPDRWQPSDFIVHGRYCRSPQIVEELEELRQAWKSKAVVLIVFREDTFFRPLLRIAHEDEARVEELQETLSTLMGFELSKPDQEGVAPDRSADLLTSLPTAELGLADIEPVVLSRLEQSHPRHLQDPPRPISRPASFYVIAFGGEPPSSASGALSQLQLMINSSAPVVAHRELEAQTDLRKQLGVTELQWQVERSERSVEQSVEDEDYAEMLLDLALKVTRSSVGNIYLADRNGRSLRLEAQRGNDQAIPEIAPREGSSQSEKPILPGVVGRVYSRGRALIINDVADYERANAHAHFLSVVRDPDLQPYAELAVPIEQGPFASSVPPFSELPKSEPIGVLNVERVRPRDSAAGDFTPTDLSALQTIALLYALRRAGSLTAFSADSLAWLTEATALKPPRASFPDPPDDPLSDVPIDMWSARSTLAYIARKIFDLTRSTSVAIRVVTPDQLSLTRFVAEPENRLHDSHATIPIDSSESVNAWVARTGLPCYIPNMLNHPTRPFPGLDGVIEIAEREGIRSELCLPIKAHGRLVGTLNLESRHKSDYPDDVAAVVGALAQQVGLAVSQARRDDERRLFSFQAQQASQAHRVLREVDDLEKLLKKNSELKETKFGAELSRVLRSIRRASDPEHAKQFEIEPISDGWVSAADLVQMLVAKPLYKGHLDIRTPPPPGMRLPKLVGQVLTLALDELLRNGLGVVSRKPNLPFVVVLRFEEIERAGRAYLRAEVVNAVAKPLVREVEQRLYRGPIHSGRTHIGAFVVGSFVRSVGGEVYVKENSSKYFGVRLELPASPLDEPQQASIAGAP
ncbi:MAG TPA: GAF domain-containing protein [Solirubrobacterales bacterium]|nr:GAF domain-containing protein [Solirubrobacterales bacterium]